MCLPSLTRTALYEREADATRGREIDKQQTDDGPIADEFNFGTILTSNIMESMTDETSKMPADALH